MALRIGVAGYGTGGRNFHTPFIEAAEGIELGGVVTRAPVRQAAAQADWPGVPVYDSLTEMLAEGRVDAVTITTPPASRQQLVLQALDAGVHVVADKPFAPTAADARELERAARAAGRLLNVFHNRRWDADLRTLARVIADGELGQVWRVHSRFDADDPDTLERGPSGGLLRDLGSHLVDQMLWLLGPVHSVTAHLDYVETDEGPTDAGFTVSMRHHNGAHSTVESSKLNHVQCRELRAYGGNGSYLSLGSDVQAQSIFAGLRPAREGARWGYEPMANWGALSTAVGRRSVPSEQGRYHDFYTQFAAAVQGAGPQPVPAADGIRTLEVLDAARQSSETDSTIKL